MVQNISLLTIDLSIHTESSLDGVWALSLDSLFLLPTPRVLVCLAGARKTLQIFEGQSQPHPGEIAQDKLSLHLLIVTVFSQHKFNIIMLEKSLS